MDITKTQEAKKIKQLVLKHILYGMEKWELEYLKKSCELLISQHDTGLIKFMQILRHSNI